MIHVLVAGERGVLIARANPPSSDCKDYISLDGRYGVIYRSYFDNQSEESRKRETL